jgi:hypothetical protein
MQRAHARSEALMGFTMAAMAVPVLWDAHQVIRQVAAWTFAAVFGALLARDIARENMREVVRDGAREIALLARRLWPVHGDPRTGMARTGRLHHLAGGAAMVYMAVSMALGASAGAGTTHSVATGGVPVVTGALLAYFAGYVLWAGTRLMPATAEPGGARPGGCHSTGAARSTGAAGALIPATRHAGVATGCRVAMGAGMFAMLLTV